MTERRPDSPPLFEKQVPSGGLYRRLFRSHMTLAALGLAMLLVMLAFTVKLRSDVHQLANVRGPTAQASLQALQGVQRSLAGLRGWMAIGQQEFRDERADAWRKDIEPGLTRLEQLQSASDAPESRARLRELKHLLVQLKDEQRQIEDVAQTPGNEPARVRLTQEADPTAEILFEAISTMIRIEAEANVDSRRTELLFAMSEARAHLTRAHEMLTAFVLSAQESDSTGMSEMLGIAKLRVADISASSTQLSARPAELLKDLESNVIVYEEQAAEVVRARQRPDWNVAHYRLREYVVPHARKALELLAAMSNEQAALMDRDAARVTTLSNGCLGLAALLIAALLIAAVVISRRSARQLSEPIALLSHATRKLAANELHEDLPITDDDELGQLMASFNQMRNSVNETLGRLQKSEQLNRKMLEAAPSGMVLTHRDGTILFVNQVMSDMFGYGRNELVGQKVEVLLPAAFHEAHKGLRTDYALHPTTRAMGSGRDLMACRKDGGAFPVEVGLNPVEMVDGMCVLASVVDITERHRHAQEREKYAQVLRNSNAALERSNTELEQFAYVASHDLQEPLRKIQAFGNLLVSSFSESLEEDAKDCIRRMQSAAGRMQTLISDLLQLSRLSRNAKPFAPVNLEETLRNVLVDLETRLGETLGEVSCNGNLPTLNADATQMRQLFQNVIGNSLKYSRPGLPPRINIGARHATLEERPASNKARIFWRIQIEDNGIGFENKYADQIFQPFRRLFERGEYEGTGIGLAICRKIVERHGGEIQAVGRPGKGATFILVLPEDQKQAIE